MSTSSNIDSVTASANATPAARLLQFPPIFLSDFVVHYRGTAFHLLKFVLCCHSTYFRTYMEQLNEGQRVYPADECDRHTNITHCIRLPDQCGKVEASVDDFRLFVCHLYFAQHYRCITRKAASDIDLTAQPPPVLTLDSLNSECAQLRPPSVKSVVESAMYALNETIMSPCHYLDCTRVPSRAEDSLLVAAQLAIYASFTNLHVTGGTSGHASSQHCSTT